jgi:hypothetical protein
MEYKKKKDWTNFAAALNQIIRLEPHFISVWKFQAWNIAYNVSVEFDDYRERYRWVIKGIEFLIQGIDYNEKNPVLHCGVGWDIAQKIGTADEKVQFRELFKADDDFHNKYRTPSLEERDNWLVGKGWYLKAEELVSQGESIGKMGENIFYARRPMCQMNFARNVESDGTYFGERAGEYWAQAHSEWTEDFGARPIRTTYRDDDDNIIKIVLNDFDGLSEELNILHRELDDLQPGLREELIAKRWQGLDEEDRNAWRYLVSTGLDEPESDLILRVLGEIDSQWRNKSVDLVRPLITKQQAAALETPTALRSSREEDLVEQALRSIGQAAARAVDAMRISMEDVARQMQGEKRRQAFQLVEKASKMERQRGILASYRSTVNFDEWRFRSRYEQYPETLAAREYVFKGRQALDDALLPEAQDYFRRGLAEWGTLLAREDCKRLAGDRDTVDDLKDVINSYVAMLSQTDTLFPEDFPLADFYAEMASGSVANAREATGYARQCLDKGDVKEAINGYESALGAWEAGMSEYRALPLMIDRSIGNDALAAIEDYAAALAQEGQTVPADFPLAKFLDLQLTHDPGAVQARQQFLLASGRVNDSEYPEAQELLEDSIKQWRIVLDRFPSILAGSNAAVAQQVSATIALYRKVFELRGKEFPEDFPLQDFVEKFEKKT